MSFHMPIAAKHRHKNLTLFFTVCDLTGSPSLGCFARFLPQLLKSNAGLEKAGLPSSAGIYQPYQAILLQKESQKPFCQAAKEITFLADKLVKQTSESCRSFVLHSKLCGCFIAYTLLIREQELINADKSGKRVPEIREPMSPLD